MSEIIAIANQKGGVGKTTTTFSLGVALRKQGNKVLLIDADPQGDLTTCMGYYDQDKLQNTIATLMSDTIYDNEINAEKAILHHKEGIDLIPANLDLSAIEFSLVNAMSREFTLKNSIRNIKDNYDYILIDCMPSLGMITINALDTEVSKLKLLKQEFMNQRYSLQDKVIKYFPEEIARLNNKIAAMEEDTVKLEEYTKPNKDGFSPMKIEGIIYSEKQDAGKKLLECVQNLKSMEEKDIGEYRGFNMTVSFDSFSKNIKLKLKNKFSYSIDLGTDINGNITRINNCLENIAKDIPTEREKLDNIMFQLENAKQEIQKEFPKEQELKEKLQKLDKINAELKINDNDHEMLGDEQEEKEERQTNKKSPERC